LLQSDFSDAWFFLRQTVFYLVRSFVELEQIEASLTIVTIRIESLRSPPDEIDARLETNRLDVTRGDELFLFQAGAKFNCLATHEFWCYKTFSPPAICLIRLIICVRS